MSFENNKNADNNWVLTSTHVKSFESQKSQLDTLKFDLNEYDKLNSSNIDLKAKSAIIAKSNNELNVDKSSLARNSLENKIIEYNKIEEAIMRKCLSSPSFEVTKKLNADTLKVLSEINMENLSLNSQFELLFNDLSMLKASAVQGMLSSTNFRFLAWMIFLECIPYDKSKWIDSINQNRRAFDKLKKEILCDPHDQTYYNDTNSQNDTTNVYFDHPLNQCKKSIWNKYFQNKDLKLIINQDVTRIHQHSKYFGYKSTQDQLVDLLFIYVRLTNSEYRQGMHEILGCIVYVLHEEYTKLAKINDSNIIIKKVADLDYLEHDAFTIFQAVMNSIHDWFGKSTLGSSNSNIDNNTRRLSRRLSYPIHNGKVTHDMNPRLFYEETNFFETPIINKINHITKILKDNDIEIFNHLNEVDVSVHPFGIRWLRLLFLRELDFPPSLIIWDAIFATDSDEFSLVDFIFVSLLICLRDEILKGDNSVCMRLLMQPHFRLDPLDVLKTALYLQDSATYSRPDIMDNSYDIINTSPTKQNRINFQQASPSTAFNNIPKAMSTSRINFNERDTNNNTSSRQQHQIQQHNNNNHVHLNQQHQQQKQRADLKNERFEFDAKKIAKKLEYHNNFFYYNNQNKRNVDRANYEMNLIKMEGMKHNVDLVNFVYIDKITELQNENQKLKHKLTEMEELCNFCSLKMNANISLLQEEMIKLNLPNRDDDMILLAIAGLKRVRDELNPNLCKNVDREDLNDKENKVANTLASADQANESSFKNKVSSFVKKNLSKVNEFSLEEQSLNIKGRLRSFSLNYPFNNGPLVSSSTTSSFADHNTIIQHKITSNLESQTQTETLDEPNVGINFNNIKLVLNNETQLQPGLVEQPDSISVGQDNKDQNQFEMIN